MKKSKVILEDVSSRKVLVIGDIMLDSFWWGQVSRISPEAPVAVFELESESGRLGGAANVAANIRAMGADTLLAGIVGMDIAGDELLQLLESAEIKTDLIMRAADRPTTIKRRMIAGNQQVLRVDTEKKHALDRHLSVSFRDAVIDKLNSVDCVVVSDYSKGLIDQFLMEDLAAACLDKKIPLLVDPKGLDYSKYRGASIITPNHKETVLACEFLGLDVSELETAAHRLAESIGVDRVLVTRGENGMTLVSKTDSTVRHFEARARKVYDVTGAGDTAIAALAIALCVGAPVDDAVEFSNEAAGLAVESIGTVTVTREMVEARLQDGY